MKTLKAVIGGILGACAGLLLSYYVVNFGGKLVFGNQFAQLAWIFSPLAVLPGLAAGSAVGIWLIGKHPIKFSATILPLGAFMLLLFALQCVDQPHHYTLAVTGTPNASFVGFVDVDGEFQQIEETIPFCCDFLARRIEFGFALSGQHEVQEIGVEIVAGKNLYKSATMTNGEHVILRSFGYSEYFGGTSHSWSRLSPEEINELLRTGRVQPKFKLGSQEF